MRAVLASHRWRRRIARASAALLVGVAVIALILVLPESNRPRPEELGGVTGRIEPEVEQRQVPITSAERESVEETLRSFVATAVTRDDPGAAWNLVTPEMRAGITRRDWNRGELPVIPYPVVVPKRLEWTVVTSYPGDLTLDLVLQPRRGSGRGAASFFVELKRNRRGRWLVDSMYAEDVFGGGSAAPRRPATAQGGDVQGARGSLSPLWIAFPLGLLALIVVVPAAIGIVSWRRQRASDRRYRA